MNELTEGKFSGVVEEGGKFSGELSLWKPVALGAAVGIAAVSFVGAWINPLFGQDSDPNTYDPNELEVVEFFPEEGLRCEGLSPESTSEILASTIVCVSVQD